MTPHPAFILAPLLARSDETDWLKLLPFAIGVVLWIIGAIASSASKAKNQARAQQTPRPAQASWPPPTLPPSLPRRPVPPPPVPKSKRRKPARPPQRRAPTARREVPVFEARAEVANLPFPEAPAKATTRAAAAGPALDAAAIRRWLRPEVLRQQYILTEVFDPPPGLRQTERGGR